MRTPRNFDARPTEEQHALMRDTWCEVCAKADLGLIDPVEYGEDGVIHVEGRCAACGAPVQTQVLVAGTNAHLQPYCLARVVRLMSGPDEYDGWNLNQRAPAVGDVGTVVEVLRAQGYPDKYVVECCDPDDGQTIWLSDLFAEELAPVAQ